MARYQHKLSSTLSTIIERDLVKISGKPLILPVILIILDIVKAIEPTIVNLVLDCVVS